MTRNKALLALLWIAGWIHVIWFTPEISGSLMEFVTAVMEANTDLLDPLVITAFNILGLWPIIMVAVLVQDNQGKLKAWPFAFSSMILGNSALYVYLFARRGQGAFIGPQTALVRFAESRLLAVFLLASSVALLIYGALQGNFSAFAATWQVNFYINVMTIDLVLFPAAFALVLADDMKRRNMPISGLFWLYALVPLLGAVCYLTFRAPLPDSGDRPTRDAPDS